METTTNFQAWIDRECLDPSDRDMLVSAIKQKSDAGPYRTEAEPNGLFVQGRHEVRLRLATKRATNAFLATLRDLEFEDDEDLDDLDAAFERAIANPHS